MLDFKELQLSDREFMMEAFKASDYRGCEFTFANAFIWRNQYKTKFARVGDFCIMASESEGNFTYTLPAGSGDIKEAVAAAIQDSRERGTKFRMRGIFPEQAELLKELFPDTFEFSTNRDECDYIYTVEKLTSLSGKKLHGKRNHIARFKDNPNWAYEQLSEANMDDCLKMNAKWCEIYSCLDDESLKHEMCAVKEAFKFYYELGLVGGLIRRDGEVVAYSIGEPLNSDTFVVHIEKAFADIQGAYPIINQQFVINNCQGFEYVNREEDLGDEGLRKAKLSYAPAIILEKSVAALREDS